MMTRVKIRKVSAADMVITTVVGLMFFVLSYLGSKQFYMLQTTTEQYVTCESAAKDLQDGSDYLTEQVRLYVMTGQQEYEDADRALYQRKAHGKAGCDFYENPSGGGEA